MYKFFFRVFQKTHPLNHHSVSLTLKCLLALSPVALTGRRPLFRRLKSRQFLTTFPAQTLFPRLTQSMSQEIAFGSELCGDQAKFSEETEDLDCSGLIPTRTISDLIFRCCTAEGSENSLREIGIFGDYLPPQKKRESPEYLPGTNDETSHHHNLHFCKWLTLSRPLSSQSFFPYATVLRKAAIERIFTSSYLREPNSNAKLP
ncbi:hypothetical protein PROFUN_06919 [Planoprotostelium fungivorum]|uniref:Uncharacterized protein n=1 Tax=Planoprotostelium fungivorum TaxID=1890364 RepID=A0A2P6NMX1_9EUKA|nr:hypothetical protein PROFUN_06919 [Planoprotostelium fungivorum]